MQDQVSVFLLVLLLGQLEILFELQPKEPSLLVQHCALPEASGCFNQVIESNVGLRLPVQILHILGVDALGLVAVLQGLLIFLKRQIASGHIPVDDFLNNSALTF